MGLDPTQLQVMNRRMDQALRGHPYVKSAIDMACWDVLGKASGQSVATLLGGRYGDDFPLYRAISQDTPEAMADSVARYRSQGYTKFQLKVGGNPDTDIARIHKAAAQLQSGDVLIADANTGWTQHQALRVADAVRDVDVYIEQPCMHYEECLAVRHHTNRPFVLDEVIDDVHMVLRGLCRQGHGRHQSEDLQGGRVDQGAADSRSVRVAGDRDDHRGYMGRRHRHRGHCAPGAQHAAGVALHGHGFQQLRDGEHRGRRAAAQRWAHGRVYRAGTRDTTAHGCAGRASGANR